MKFSEKTKGSISVFLVLILLPFFTCFYLGLLSLKKTAIDRTLHGSMNLAGNGALHAYNPTLKRQYGIFAVNQEEDLLEHEISIMLSNMVESNNQEGSPFMSLKMNDFALYYPLKYSLYREEILKQQIMEYMKYRAPLIFANELSKKIPLFFELPKISSVMKKSEDYYNSLEKADDSFKKAGRIVSEHYEVSDIESEKKTIKLLLKEISNFEQELYEVSENAEAWNNSLKKMEDGELKNIFLEDYKNAADFLTSDNIKEFEEILKNDLSILEKAEKEGDNLPSLSYRTHSLYKYLNSINSSDVTDEKKENAKRFKENLSEIAGNKEKIKELSFSKEINIGSLLPSDFRQIEHNKKTEESFEKLFSESGKAKDYRNACFIEEYIAKMFSCAVTSNEKLALTGRPLNESPIFGCEMEYILIGKDSAYKNISLMKGLLFQIRFLLNSCYLFSSVEMKSKAMSVAVALAAATGFGAKAIQYALLVLWATAETVLDISSLMKGKSVPLYKNRYTWTLSIEGLAEKVKDDATEYTCNHVDDIYKKLVEKTDKGFDQLEGNIKEFFENTERGVTEKISNMIMLHVESFISKITEDLVFGGRKLSKEEIKEELIKVTKKAENGSRGFEVAYEIFIDHILDELVDDIYEPYSEIFINDSETISQAAAQKIEQEIHNQYVKYSSLIEKRILEITEEGKNEVKKCLLKGKDISKEELTIAIEKYTDYLSEFTGHDTDYSEESFSSCTGLGLTYEDYIRVFLLLRLKNKDTQKRILSRTAEVMQINCFKEEKTFDLRRCTLGICLKAEVKIGTGIVKREETYVF